MLEDVLGWIIVLIGAIVMKFTDLAILDPILSIALAIFILVNAAKNLFESISFFLEKAPSNIDTDNLCKEICSIDGVLDVHHVHLWALDEKNVLISMHIVTKKDTEAIKKEARCLIKAHGITHATLETEGERESCDDADCKIESYRESDHDHHHHHHHHHH
jgi:cobalt-zinc-cadmium efflux system protein